MSVSRLKVHKVIAYNTAKTSDNKIHDDAVARKFGFAGGLVPGVDVYAYMTHAPVSIWGRDWLENGWMNIRLVKPVYEGEETSIRPTLKADGNLDIVAESRGIICGEAVAGLATGESLAPDLGQYPHLSLPDEKPPATPETLPAELALGAIEDGVSHDDAPRLLADVREDLPIYSQQNLIHPGYLLRMANWILRENVTLGPWIHVSSEVQHFAAAIVGTPLSARGRVAENFVRKGHKFVVLDVLVLQDETLPLLHIKHTAIYQPRQAAA